MKDLMKDIQLGGLEEVWLEEFPEEEMAEGIYPKGH